MCSCHKQFNLFEHSSREREHNWYLKYLLLAFAVLTTGIYLFTQQFWFFVFAHASLVIVLVGYSLYLIMYIDIEIDCCDRKLTVASPNHTHYHTPSFNFNFMSHRHHVLLLRTLFTLAMIGYVGGFVAWILDNVMCDTVQSYQLHALWHIGAGSGTYLWLLFTVAARAPTLQCEEELRSIKVMSVPTVIYVHFTPKTSNTNSHTHAQKKALNVVTGAVINATANTNTDLNTGGA